MSLSLLRQLLMKEAVKKSAGSSGIMTINKNITADVDKLLQKYINDAMQQGVDLDTLSPEQLKMIVAMNQPKTSKIISSGEVIPFKQKRSFAEEIDAMKKSGDIVDADDVKISEKITDRDMFNNSFLNKPTVEGQMEKITGASNKIKQIQKEQADMYKPKSDAEIKAKYDKQNKESVERFKNKRQLTKEELEDFEMEIGGDNLEAYYFDGTLGSANRIRKEQADYVAQMRREYQRGNLDPKPGEANRERFLQKKFDEMESSGDNRLMTRDEVEELSSFGLQKDMDKSVKKFKEKDAKQKKTLKDFDPEDRDPSATGGRAGYYGGGPAMVGEDLSEIGHGSDSLMARNMQLSPNSQATTSTGLDYLLGEDNDTVRIPFGNGNTVQDKIKTMHKDFDDYRKGGGTFSYKKFAAAYIPENFAEGGRIGYKDGSKFGVQASGSKSGKQQISNAPEGITSDKELINAILTMDIPLTKKVNLIGDVQYGKFRDKIEYKDNEIFLDDPKSYRDRNIGLDYNRDGEGFSGSATVGDRGPEFNIKYKKSFAEGGRIGFAGGGGGRRAFLKMIGLTGAGIAGLKSGLFGISGKEATKKAITETVKQTAPEGVPPYFLNLVKKIKTMGDDVTEKAATQDRQKITKYKDYELTEDIATGRQEIQRMKVLDDDSASYYGQPLTEETYMSYTPGENIIGKGGKPVKTKPEYEEGTALLRSDKQFAGDVVDESATISDDVIKEGTMFEDTITEFGKADGGRIGFSGGGIIRAIIAKSAAKKGLKPYEYIKATNYKGLPPEVRMYISADEFARLKSGQEQLYGNFIDMAKTRLNFQKQVEGGKTTPARELFEGMEKTMDEQSFVPKTVTSDDIAQMELMVKNRFNKGRKDNAEGGLQTMLGE